MVKQENKVWFITGASSGFGLAMVKLLLSNGNKVTATSRNKKSIEDQINAEDPNLLTITVDLTNEKSIKDAIAKTVETFGHIDVVVNNAGYMHLGSLEEVSAEEFHQSMTVNVYAFLHVIRNAMPYFRKQRSGHIFNFSSSAGYSGDECAGSYNAVKWAVIGLSEALSKEVKPFDVKVTVVSPGLFRTGFLNKGGFSVAEHEIGEYDTQQKVEIMNQFNGQQPGDPDKLAEAVIKTAEEEHPPLHLIMGPDAYERVTEYYQAQLSELGKWKEVSLSTNFQ